LIIPDWTKTAATEVARRIARDGDRSDVHTAQQIIEKHCPFKRGVAYEEVSTIKDDEIAKLKARIVQLENELNVKPKAAPVVKTPTTT